MAGKSAPSPRPAAQPRRLPWTTGLLALQPSPCPKLLCSLSPHCAPRKRSALLSNGGRATVRWLLLLLLTLALEVAMAWLLRKLHTAPVRRLRCLLHRSVAEQHQARWGLKRSPLYGRSARCKGHRQHGEPRSGPCRPPLWLRVCHPRPRSDFNGPCSDECTRAIGPEAWRVAKASRQRAPDGEPLPRVLRFPYCQYGLPSITRRRILELALELHKGQHLLLLLLLLGMLLWWRWRRRR